MPPQNLGTWGLGDFGGKLGPVNGLWMPPDCRALVQWIRCHSRLARGRHLARTRPILPALQARPGPPCAPDPVSLIRVGSRRATTVDGCATTQRSGRRKGEFLAFPTSSFCFLTLLVLFHLQLAKRKRIRSQAATASPLVTHLCCLLFAALRIPSLAYSPQQGDKCRQLALWSTYTLVFRFEKRGRIRSTAFDKGNFTETRSKSGFEDGQTAAAARW